ncbi:phosphoribosylformylglycinamidine synthase I [Patescibacteria group bacterium]|nr:phosphoribosylformylglycinamidine synthase I [Patescibacteria group bacterium]
MKKKPKIAVIQFPGTNCELETFRAVERNGMTAEHFRWNEKKSLRSFDGAILAGGFSYEDRGRSGLIASKDPLLKEVFALAKRGGVVLGICNGAQILVETGLVPNFEFGKSVIALTQNRRVKDGEIQGSGYFNEWIFVKPGSERANAFNQFEGVLKIPIAHAEGRFFSEDANLLSEIVDKNLNAFIYCDASGDIRPEFPTNPNGSVLNLAGISNPAGNVCALMPHPERTKAGDPIFASMRKWISGEVDKPATAKLRVKTPITKILPKPEMDVEFFVSLKITDNEALSVGKAAGLKLKKFRWFGLDFNGKLTSQISGGMLEKIIRSGELLNPEKEEVFVKFSGKIFKFSKDKCLIAAKFQLPKNRVLASEKEQSLEEARRESLNRTLGKNRVKKLWSGVLWGESENRGKFEKAVKANFFHHPAAMELVDCS